MAMSAPLQLLYLSVLAGVASSAYILRACARPPVRLLKRQLFHQAAATLFIDVWKALLMTWPLAFGGEADCLGDLDNESLTTAHRTLSHGLFFGTWLIDMHIAASTAAISFRASLVFSWLGRHLHLVWVVAACFGIQAVVVARLSRRSDVQNFDRIGASMVVLTFYFTIGLYVASLISSMRDYSPDSVLRRMRNRAMVYPLIFIVSVFPTVLRYFDLFSVCTDFGILSFVAEHATATFNALAFYMLSGVPPKTVAPGAAVTELAKRESDGRAPRTKQVGFMDEIDVQSFEVTQEDRESRKSGYWSSTTAHTSLEGSDLPDTVSDSGLWSEYVGEEEY